MHVLRVNYFSFGEKITSSLILLSVLACISPFQSISFTSVSSVQHNLLNLTVWNEWCCFIRDLHSSKLVLLSFLSFAPWFSFLSHTFAFSQFCICVFWTSLKTRCCTSRCYLVNKFNFNLFIICSCPVLVSLSLMPSLIVFFIINFCLISSCWLHPLLHCHSFFPSRSLKYSSFDIFCHPRWLVESSPSVAYRENKGDCNRLNGNICKATDYMIRDPLRHSGNFVWKIRNMIQLHLWSNKDQLRLKRGINIKWSAGFLFFFV